MTVAGMFETRKLMVDWVYFGGFETFEAIECKINQSWTQSSTLKAIYCNSPPPKIGPESTKGLRIRCIPGVFIYIDRAYISVY